MASILILDIETTPNLAYVWKFFKENMAPKQIMSHSQLLSFSAKWLGDSHVFYKDTSNMSEKALLRLLLAMLTQADIVVAHNGKKFDIPVVYARALVYRLAPPSPFKIVDTFEVAKKQFKFGSNKLEYLANILNCTPKNNHKNYPGFELWLECMKGNKEAFLELEFYNKQDVLTLEEVYLKMRPYIINHPNLNIYVKEEKIICPKCGGTHFHKRGIYQANVFTYQKYQCQECGGWFRSRQNEMPLEKRKMLVVNAI